MDSQTFHMELTGTTLDEYNRQLFTSDLRMFLLNDIAPGMRKIYDKKVRQTTDPSRNYSRESARDINEKMFAHPYTRFYSTLIRSTQEMMWDSVLPGIERNLPDIIEKTKPRPTDIGTLTLDPSVDVPFYVSGSDVHCMPGNYHSERLPDDVAAGVLFDRGLYIYAGGAGGENSDGNGRTMAEMVKRRFPDFKPRRILDLGCTIGNNTLPWADVFPDAELHAIDVAAPVLRFAHARAEALGRKVHFHQMNAEKLAFDDESFDLVVSCILFHETSTEAFHKIVGEIERVLKPGGLMMHMETWSNDAIEGYDAFYTAWDGLYNNEPFIDGWRMVDKRKAWIDAGFPSETHVEVAAPDFYATPEDEFDRAARGQSNVLASRSGHWGEDFTWEMFGAWKPAGAA
jgi:ubiquinone/menaquinone biosynthesis C-methylase UbiE